MNAGGEVLQGVLQVCFWSSRVGFIGGTRRGNQEEEEEEEEEEEGILNWVIQNNFSILCNRFPVVSAVFCLVMAREGGSRSLTTAAVPVSKAVPVPLFRVPLCHVVD
jgi:hypothetical protein